MPPEGASPDLLGPMFMELVDEYLESCPVRTQALSRASLRFAAAKILIRRVPDAEQRGLKPVAGEEATRLAAILLVLFAEEGLQSTSDGRAGAGGRGADVLGMTSRGLYEMIEALVARNHIDRDELIEMVIDVDLGERATQLMQSREIDVLWSPRHRTGSCATRSIARDEASSRHGGGGGGGDGGGAALGGPRQRRTTAASNRRRLDRDAQEEEAPLFVPESAQLEQLASSSHVSPDLLRVLQRQLAKRFQLVQRLVLGTCGVYFVLAECIGHVFPSARALFYLVFLCVVFLVVVISFPTDLTCPAARQLMQPLTSVFAVAVVHNMSRGFFVKSPDVNEACTLINAILYVVSCVITLFMAYSAYARNLTWRRVHALFIADGIAFGLAALALRYYAGAPIHANVYPPCGNGQGCVTFHPALLRAFVPLAMSLAFPRGVRTRAAAAANRCGWNHVAISLDEMLRRRSRSASRLQAADSFSSRDASEQDVMSHSSCTSAGGSLWEMERQRAVEVQERTTW